MLVKVVDIICSINRVVLELLCKMGFIAHCSLVSILYTVCSTVNQYEKNLKGFMMPKYFIYNTKVEIAKCDLRFSNI